MSPEEQERIIAKYQAQTGVKIDKTLFAIIEVIKSEIGEQINEQSTLLLQIKEELTDIKTTLKRPDRFFSKSDIGFALIFIAVLTFGIFGALYLKKYF